MNGITEASLDSSISGGTSGGTGNTSVYKFVQASGNPMIDGLLSGVSWKFNNFSVSYPTSGTSYGLNYANGEQTTFSPFTEAQRLAADFALSLISDYAPVTFTTGSPSTANIRFGNYQGTQTHAYYPDGFQSMGDVWYGTGNGDQFTADIGGFAYATIFHEIGHALGLKHGQDIGMTGGGTVRTADGLIIPNFAPLPANFDNWNYALMSYRSYQGARTDFVQGHLDSNNPVTYMIADIAALQHMYGANFSGFSSTNTLYQWGANGDKFVNGDLFLPAAIDGKVFEAIWDGGGVDTYDTSNFNTNQVIDLRPGMFSTFDSAKLADLDRFAPGRVSALGNIANALQFRGDPRSLIENAVTGNGSDVLIGNAANNDLRGLGGNDFLSGGDGSDLLTGGLGADGLDGGAGFDYARYNTATQGVVAWMANPGINTGEAAGDTFVGIEGMIGSVHGDSLGGDDANNHLWGLGGNDALHGFGGVDSLFGADGNDSLRGGIGADILDGGAGLDAAVFTGSRAAYTVRANGTGLRVTGSDGADALTSIESLVFDNRTVSVVATRSNGFVDADFNGDGIDDVLWQHDSGYLVEWLMRGGNVAVERGLGSFGTGWTVAGAGDFNGDTIDDVLWRHESGYVSQWLMSGGQVGAVAGLGMPGPGWTVAAVADLNGDRFDDIIWQHDSGYLLEWLIRGGKLAVERGLGMPGADWTFAGAGDFNGDTIDDIIWRHDSGYVQEWLMSGGQVGVVGGVGMMSRDWMIAGTGNFNGGGADDILWRHTNGSVSEWLMGGSGIAAVVDLGSPDATWTLAGTGDVSGNGTTDLLWRLTDGSTRPGK